MRQDRPANFDHLAGSYDRLAGIVFGNTLHSAQAEGLQHLVEDSEIAIFGGGSGRILEDLLATGTRFRTIYYVDASEKMIARAMARVRTMENRPAEGIVQFFTQPAEDWCSEYSGSVDTVITPFFLDCFEGSELKKIVAQIGSLIRKDGQWLVTDFVTSPRLRHRLLMAAMFKFFRLTCQLQSSKLEAYFDAIGDSGFRSLEHREYSTAAGPVRWERFERELHFDVDS